MFTRIREIWQNFRAWRRGERRMVPYGIRGRVYARESALPSSAVEVETKTVYKTLARVIRADESPDEYYNLSEDKKLSADAFGTLRGDMNHG